MALSEYEQRVLAEMEQQLRAADPKLAQSMGAARSGVDVRRISLAVLAVVIGLGALVGAVATSQIWLGILGFLIMLGAVLCAITPGARGRRSKSKTTKPKTPTSFMDKQNDRWDNRRHS